MVLAGANVPDCQLLRQTIEAIVVERPAKDPERPQHLCLDKGYDNPTGRAAAVSAGHRPHIRRIGEERWRKKRRPRAKPRRWVVERALAWLSKCRGILVRYAKKPENYLGMIQLACALLWYRRQHRLSLRGVLR